MEPKEGFITKYIALRTNDFLRFLDKNGVTNNCVMCGNPVSVVSETMKHTLSNPAPIEYATLFRHSTVIDTDHPQNYYYQIYCEKCGFNSTFNALVVFKWLEADQSKEGEDDPNE
ncbi:hypothetical protein [Serratia liquefaciens]|uniref:Uncharacterized protein n=1 Tax=Serratia liquefaciens TaxID=614 RepID=A0ABX7D7V5_SERLI|nr:hypothetical protein [Serratia liquefaciens]QQU56451.1 hypothetical protein I6I38_05450 [Serratia liquefaciens]